LALLAEGLSNRAVGERLGISERTVKFHVGEILGRLGASNRAQAVAIAQARGLV
jgi:DNA-binding NarL/FixJ family response regulator